MTEHSFEGLSLHLYADLVMSLVDGAISMSLRDASGTTLWHHHRDNKAAIDLAAWFPPDGKGWQPLEGDVFSRKAGDNMTLYARVIRGGHASGRYYLCLLHEAQAAAAALRPASEIAQRLVASMSQIIGSHHALNHELNTMTDELIRRYEELNLVYNTDDEARYFSEGALALSRIVENCTEYLGVDTTALYLMGKERVMMRSLDGARDNSEVQMVKDLREDVLEWMVANNTSVAMNTAEERETCGLNVPDGYRLVASPIRNIKGRVRGALVVINRMSSREFENGDRNLLKVMAEKASKIIRANYDSLTGLMSREGFERTVATVLPEAVRSRRDVCLVHANVDQLQLVNDTFGHEAGDDLIRRIADVLGKELRGNDRIARLGGDEFGILLTDCSEDNAKKMAERLCVRVAALECVVGQRRLDVGVSVGVVKINRELDSVVSAMAAADLACSAAKEQGRNRAFVYRENDLEMQERREQMHWVGTLQRAIKADRFTLFSQVIAPARAGVGRPHYEILLRMLGSDDEYISPGIFMPVAERYHLMPAIDRWVIQHSLETIAQWWSSGEISNSVFAINLSGQTLTDQHTLDFLISQLRESPVDARNVCFEITETEAITNLSSAQHFITCVRDLGSRFALDDFGAGMTSFTNLRALDVDYLKIDGSFVIDMAKDPISHAMVSAINSVGQTMNLDTVAEFVESAEIREMLADMGVDYLQGYHIARPRALVEQLSELAGADARIA